MAQQNQSPSSLNAQLSDMMDDLSNSEPMMGTGPFVPMEQVHSPMQRLGSSARTTTTAVSLPASAVSSPALSNRFRRPVSPSPARSSSSVVSNLVRMDNEHSRFMPRAQHQRYHSRTIDAENMSRMAFLPIFPLVTVQVQTVTNVEHPSAAAAVAAASSSMPGRIAPLLLTNVPINEWSPDQHVRLRRGAFPSLFKLEKTNAATNTNDSFLLRFYEDFYRHLTHRLKVDVSILDFNCMRLRKCIELVARQYALDQTMLHFDELATALEFYLQIDVDLFFLKTCSFNGVKPRLFEERYPEGLFCLDTPTARFGITPCGKASCHCCHSPCPRRQTTTTTTATTIIRFSDPHIHRFVNQYDAILNCPATCESTNCIYVLTCPCGQFDFIGESKVSFAETLALHRQEGNRIIREFLMGERNIEYLTQGLKSEKKKLNDQSWLYQHSARCSVALQFFLDYNPEYWCFVPMKNVEQQRDQGIVRGYLARQSSHREYPSPSETDFFTTWNRKDADVHRLRENLPQPPFGYGFTPYQRQQQANFFKWTQDRNVPLYNVDLYNADIIAILPANVSKLFRKTIESLLITHAECKLNQTGHLVSAAASGQVPNLNPNRALNNVWCVNLARHPTST